MTCVQGYDVKVLPSAAGYYIGTTDEGYPNCRVSGYFHANKAAHEALESMAFDERQCIENEFCRGFENQHCLP